MSDDNVFLDRRMFLGLAASGVMAALLSRSRLARAQPAALKNACILLWLNGGPSHIDTFDPKPGRASFGPLKSIKTKAPAIELAETLPRLAEQADRIAVIRGMTSREGNHQRAQFLVHTGYAPSTTIEYPSLGAWTSKLRGDKSDDLPAFVSIGGASIDAGFLGVEHAPFVLRRAGGLPDNVGYAPGVDAQRFSRRLAGLDALESRFAGEVHDAKVDGRRAVYEKAVRLMRSPRVRAFDLASEPEAIRAAYGDHDFGRACLLARRLVENGVRFVEVVLDGWDTHKDNFGRVRRLAGMLDSGFSALLKDLGDRGMLATTLVACMGEFGRTPRINGNDGRDHHPKAWSAVMAGANVRGGVVHGATDQDGEGVVQDPTQVPDLIATMAAQLGMSPAHTESSPIGRPISVTDSGKPIAAILRG